LSQQQQQQQQQQPSPPVVPQTIPIVAKVEDQQEVVPTVEAPSPPQPAATVVADKVETTTMTTYPTEATPISSISLKDDDDSDIPIETTTPLKVIEKPLIKVASTTPQEPTTPSAGQYKFEEHKKKLASLQQQLDKLRANK